LTAEQAAAQSKVPLRLVHVLESGDYHLMPDPLYLIRLVHDYALFLGLDAGAIDAEFERAMHQPLRASAPTAVARPAAPAIQWKQVRWTVAAIVVIAPLVAIALFLAGRRTSDETIPSRPSAARPDEAASASASAASAADGVSDGLTRPGSSDATPLPGAAVTPAVGTHATPPAPGADTPPPSRSSGHILVVRAQEPTWLSVRADRKDRREVLLQGGQTARFEAETDFHIIVGNAGGVMLSFDGTSLPPLGRSGEVIRNLVLPPVRRDSSPSDAALPSSTR
jgi:cytoskeleton protein RodZ